MSRIRPPRVAVLLLLGGALAFAASSTHWDTGRQKDQAFEPRIKVVPPPPAALALAFGDRFLASDLATVRAMVAASNLEDEPEKTQFARLLETGLALNPAQEDAYYITEAYLPWHGRVQQAQDLLTWATDGRPWDWMPLFFRAFNQYYFNKRPIRGAELLRQAAERSAPRKAAQLQAVAGRWSALGRDPRQALKMVESMARGTKLKPLQRNLKRRARQLKGLLRLREAAQAFEREKGRPPQEIGELLGHAGLASLPKDPTGDGYIVDDSGQVRVRPPDLDRLPSPEEQGA